MAIFSDLAITARGTSALAALAAGTGERLTFTRVSASDKECETENLESLTELENIRQSAEVSNVYTAENGTTVIEAALENKTLSDGYYVRTLGLFARTDGEEFLFAAAAEQSGGCYMPPYNGKTLGGMLVSLAVAVSDTENITVEAGSAAAATLLDIQRLETAIAEHGSDANAHAELCARLAPPPVAFSVETSAWTALSTAYAGCGYSAEIAAEGVTAEDFPDVYFDGGSIEAASAAEIIAGTDSGKVVLYADSIPAIALSGACFIRKGASQ